MHFSRSREFCWPLHSLRFLGPGISKVILALVITGWAGYARLARAQVLKVKELELFWLRARWALRQPRILAAPFASEYFAACFDPGHYRNGRCHFGRIDAKFSGTGRARAAAELGRDAKRRAQSPVRRAAHGYVSCVCGDACGSRFQFAGRCLARLAGPAYALADGGDRTFAIALECGSGVAPALRFQQLPPVQMRRISI